LTPASTHRAAIDLAARLSTEQRHALNALADVPSSASAGADLEQVRGRMAELNGAPVSRQRVRRVLYELGASSLRYSGAAARVQRVSTVRLINSSGGQGGASARRHRLTPFAVEVLAALIPGPGGTPT
jgi:hypothetical protein